MAADRQPTTAACAFGDPTCPCQDGDVCHYVDDPLSETKAMTRPMIYHCLQCNCDVPADEVHEAEWMPGRVGTFHTCGDFAHRQSRQEAPEWTI